MINNVQDPKGFEKMELIFKHPHAKIYNDYCEDRLFVRWWGQQSHTSIRTIGTSMSKLLRVKGYHQILNCNQFVRGSFTQMDNWILDIWVPMMIDAGLKNFAWILSPDESSRQSAATMVGKDEEQLLFKFNTLKEGEEWLNNMKKKSSPESHNGYKR